MKTGLNKYALAAALIISLCNTSTQAYVALSSDNTSRTPASAEAQALLEVIDTPVALFKTTAKDPYLMVYKPGASILETIVFGWYKGEGTRVDRVSDATKQLELMVPIRQTILFEDGPVKLEKKFVGWRESAIARGYEDVFKALGIMANPYYKGTPLLDQYLEGIPMKWVLNEPAEITSLRKYLQPLFDQAGVAGKGERKPILIIEFDGQDTEVKAEDQAFINKYFCPCSLTDDAIKTFFTTHQGKIRDAIVNGKDAKQVGEGFVDIMFRKVESVTQEFKTKEMAAAIVFGLISVHIFNKLEKHVDSLFDEHIVQPVHEHVVQPVRAGVHRHVIKPVVNAFRGNAQASAV